MPTLQLTIPAQQISQSAIKIKPAEVHEWLDNLPYMNLARAAGVVSEQLRLMNRQPMAAAARLEIVDAFSSSLHRLLDIQSSSLVSKKDCSAALKRLTQDIGFGYKIVAIEMSEKPSSVSNRRTLANALGGSLHNLGMQLQHYYEQHQKAPRAIWDECVTLYEFSCEQELVGSRRSYPHLHDSEIGEIFRIITLSRLTDPYHLPGGIISILADYFHMHVQLCQVAKGIPRKMHEYCIPMQASDDSEKEVLWLDITMLMSQLSADIMRLDGGSKSTVIGMAQEIPAASLQKALTQIFNHWQRGPSRSNDRKSIHASLDLAAGINDGYCQLNKGCPFDPSLYQSDANEPQSFPDTPAPTQSKKKQLPMIFSCVTVNRSEGGLALRYRDSGKISSAPASSQLLTIRHSVSGDPESNWVIGICRWIVQTENHNGFELGVEYLLGKPKAAVLRDTATNGAITHHPVICITHNNDHETLTSLIVAPDQIEPGREYELIDDGEIKNIRCTKSLESGVGFSQLAYRPVYS